MTLTVSKLTSPVQAGDWHDKLLRYEVTGAERQLFSTKKEAQKWASIRRRSADFNSAFEAWNKWAVAQP